jgi:hypothetical protein
MNDCFHQYLPFPDTEKSAYAGFLIGDYRPAPAIHRQSTNGSFFSKRTFRFSALPSRWISVTASVWAVLQENPACLIRCVAMTRQTMRSL